MRKSGTRDIIIIAVTLIAVKREVAAGDPAGFPWSECLEYSSGAIWRELANLTTSHCTNECLQSGQLLKAETTCDTRDSVQSPLVVLTKKCEKEATFFMANQVMRITLKAYDHELVDASAKKIIETVKKNGSQVSGPVPLPTKKEVVTILRAVHKYKDSREQFEQRTHKRLIDIITPTQKTVDALQRLEMPAGVYIDIKMKTK